MNIMHLLWYVTIVWILNNSVVVVSTDTICGHVEIVKPAIDGRNITLKYIPNNVTHTTDITWTRSRTLDAWIDLLPSPKFVQYQTGSVHYLKITNADLNDDGINYKVRLSNGTSVHCETDDIHLAIKSLSGCGFLYLRTKRVVLNETVELGYFPTSHMLKYTDSYIRCWLHVSQQGRCIDTSDGRYQETLQMNNEYVLKIHNYNNTDDGYYSIQCTRGRNVNKFTESVEVSTPVPPNGLLIASPQETLDGCNNCITGEDKQRIKVLCKIIGGTTPFNISIRIGTTQLLDVKDADTRVHIVFLNLNNTQHHLSDAVCSVENYATAAPISEQKIVYVKMISYAAPVLILPTRLVADDPVNITCTQPTIRPPATNLTILVDGEVLHGIEYKDALDSATLLYNSSVTLTVINRQWNQRLITCCEYNKEFLTNDSTICSTPKTIKIIFPPDAVELQVNTAEFKEEQIHYIVTAECHITNSYPACNASWNLRQPNLIGQELYNRTVNVTDYSVTSIFVAQFNVSVSDVGKVLTCTADCSENFTNLLNSSWNILVPHIPTLAINTSQTSTRVSRGSVLFVKCTASGYPMSNLRWYDVDSNETRVNCDSNDFVEDTLTDNVPFGRYGTTECMLMVDTVNMTTETKLFMCIADHLFGSVEQNLTVHIYVSNYNDQNSLALMVGIGTSPCVLVFCVCVVVMCKIRSKNDSGKNKKNKEQNGPIEPQSLETSDSGHSPSYANMEFDYIVKSTPYAYMKPHQLCRDKFV